MIHVDISNIWGELSLQDLLGIEQEIFAAHASLPEEMHSSVSAEEAARILKAAQTIRADSDICVVVGSGGSCLGAQAAIELLQGTNRNTGKGNPRIFFAGNSFSTRQWNDLRTALEGRDFSVIVISGSGTVPESAIALRGLKWMMERKYGTDECNRRIYAITDPVEGGLRQMADAHGWESFALAPKENGCFGALSPAGLLPMAVAGIDIAAVVEGAAEDRESWDLRSFENPVWLYAAVRNLMHRSGKTVELLASWEPGFGAFGKWWQHLFLEAEGGGLFPVCVEFPADHGLRLEQRSFFETMIRFESTEQPHVIASDVSNPDGLDDLADRNLDEVEAQAFLELLEEHTDSGVSVITMECGAPDARTVGQLFAFLELSCALSARTLESGSAARTDEG